MQLFRLSGFKLVVLFKLEFWKQFFWGVGIRLDDRMLYTCSNLQAERFSAWGTLEALGPWADTSNTRPAGRLQTKFPTKKCIFFHFFWDIFQELYDKHL